MASASSIGLGPAAIEFPVGMQAVLPTLGFYPKILGFFGTLGFSWDFYFKNKTLGFFLGFFRIQKIILNINFLILIYLLVRESYPVINIIR